MSFFELPILAIVIPCYNEEEVLPITAPIFQSKIQFLINKEVISKKSKIVFIDDGSKDSTWNIIEEFSKHSNYYTGIRLSRNRGHQNAVYAGLMDCKDWANITISIDCDGQDDIDAMDEMINAYRCGAEIVYGVRNDRETDSFFKKYTAQFFYKLMEWLGVESVFNHADYRLVSSKVLEQFAKFDEVILS